MKRSATTVLGVALLATMAFSVSAFGQQAGSGAPAQQLSAPQAETAPQVATSTVNKNDPEAVVCKKEQVVGSRFPKTVCTRASDRANSQELARQLQGNFGNAGGN